MPLILGEFLVMAGGFFVVFFVLITCINVQSNDRANRHRRRERPEIRYR